MPLLGRPVTSVKTERWHPTPVGFLSPISTTRPRDANGNPLVIPVLG